MVKKFLLYILLVACTYQKFDFTSLATTNSDDNLEPQRESSHTCIPEYSTILEGGMLDILTLGIKTSSRQQIRFKHINTGDNVEVDLCSPENIAICDKWDSNTGKCSDISLEILIKKNDQYQKTTLNINNNIPSREAISTKLFGIIPTTNYIYLTPKQDQICVQSHMIFYYPFLGCTFIQDPFTQSIYHEMLYDDPVKRQFSSDTSVQSITKNMGNCIKDTQKHSSSEISRPIFSTIYLCASRMLNNAREKSLFDVRMVLVNFVKYCLTLYVIFIGFNLILTQEINKTIFITHIVKIIFVMYFAVGISTENDKVENGFDKYIIPFVENAGTQISSFLVGVGSRCSKITTTNYEEGYKLLSFWNYIDCYFRVFLPNPIFLMLIFIFTKYSNLLLVTLPLQYIIIVSMMFLFVIETFIRSLVVISLLAIVSPIFITMYLFNFTQEYFRNFIQINLSMILQPFVASLYIFLCILVLEHSTDGVVDFAIKHGTDFTAKDLFLYIFDLIKAILFSTLIIYILLRLRGQISHFIAFITTGPTLTHIRNVNIPRNNNLKKPQKGDKDTKDSYTSRGINTRDSFTGRRDSNTRDSFTKRDHNTRDYKSTSRENSGTSNLKDSNTPMDSIKTRGPN